MAKFSDLQFFIGELDEEMKGMVVLSLYGDDGSPYFYYFKDGLIEEKQVSSYTVTIFVSIYSKHMSSAN